MSRKRREVPSLPEDISGYGDAQANGDRFYIAAQFERGKLPSEFVLGNGKTYGGYENAPLQSKAVYIAYIRGVTIHNGVSLYCTCNSNCQMGFQALKCHIALFYYFECLTHYFNGMLLLLLLM